MSENQATLRYTYRLRPGVTAEARLLLEWNCSRWVWNQCVEAGNASYAAYKAKERHEGPTFVRIAKRLTAWRAEHEWLRQGSQCVQQQTVRRWAASYQQAFNQPAKGFPKFKSSKVSLPSMEYTSNAFRLKDGVLCLAGGITIPVVWSRALPSEPKSCVVSRNGQGHWFVSFVVRRESETFPVSYKAIGIDWGVAEVATATDSRFNLSCGNQTKNNADALKKANRKLSRAKRDTKNRKAAKCAVSAIHIRMARQRKDRAFKWSRSVVMAFGNIAIENFKPGFLAKSTMAKKAADGAVGMTKRILITMATAAGRNVVLVNPAYTTMTCSACGSRNKAKMELRNRTFVCEGCGHATGRDENAARVILDRAGFNPANVDGVRPLHDFGCAGAT